MDVLTTNSVEEAGFDVYLCADNAPNFLSQGPDVVHLSLMKYIFSAGEILFGGKEGTRRSWSMHHLRHFERSPSPRSPVRVSFRRSSACAYRQAL